MDTKDYPALCQESGKCADYNQKRHMLLLKIRIGILIGYALLGAVAWTKVTELAVIPLAAITVVLSVGLVLTVVFEMRKFDRLWYGSRTLSEAIKKETWLFMMRVPPYDLSIVEGEVEKKPEDNVEKEFIENLHEICSSHSGIVPELTRYRCESGQLTPRMRQVRQLGVEERAKVYSEERLQDQQQWYDRKARFNLKKTGQYSILMWFFQALTVIFAVINVVSPSPYNLIGPAATTSTAILLWANTKGYSELSQAYGFTAQELDFQKSKTEYVKTQDQLVQFVLENETLMGQERTVWNARRQPSIKPVGVNSLQAKKSP
jgi:hypothetical protein